MTEKNKDVRMDDGRMHMLEERVSHTDQRVTELAQGVATIQASQKNMAEVLNKVADRVNAPNTTNWVGLVGACVSVVTILGLGVALYTAPLAARLDRHDAFIQYQQGEHEEEAALRGKYEVRLLNLEREEARDYEADAIVEGRLTRLENAVSAGTVSRRAIGDYLKELRGDFHRHIGDQAHD